MNVETEQLRSASPSPKHPMLVSFVHGYQDLKINLPDVARPALWKTGPDGSKTFSYYFPRNPEDFPPLGGLIAGTMPGPNEPTFQKLPRFGFTGLRIVKEHAYAGSWNAIFRIRLSDMEVDSIITHPLMNDMHGIWADENQLIGILTCKDTIVFYDHEGRLVDHFSIGRDLSVYKNPALEEVDWRFVGKQFRGSAGLFHFNYAQILGDELWLTSRNANGCVVVNLKTRKAWLRLMNLPTPALIHDGGLHQKRHYFTSVDGKVFIAEYPEDSSGFTQEEVPDVSLFTRDLVSKVIRLEETALDREPNWCRGCRPVDDVIYLTIDGRYDTALRFGLLGIDEEGAPASLTWLNWEDVGSTESLRFVTGFDLATLP